MKVNRSFNADNAAIEEIVDFVKESLEKCGLKGKNLTHGCLVAEEVSRIIILNSDEDMIHVHIRKLFGKTHMEISSKGEKFSLVDHVEVEQLLGKESSATAQNMIGSILIRSMAESLKYRHVNGTNMISFTTEKVKQSFLFQTLGAMIIAMIVGYILSEAGFTEFNNILAGYILEPVKKMYMNGLKMVVAPVVFFSIVSCIVRFTDVRELGHMGGKILGLYLVTTVIAALVGIGVFDLIRPGARCPRMLFQTR